MFMTKASNASWTNMSNDRQATSNEQRATSNEQRSTINDQRPPTYTTAASSP